MDSSFFNALGDSLLNHEGRNISSSYGYLEPKLVVNDYNRGVQTLTTLEKELASCDSFSLSVAFITQGGLTPLLMVLDELKERGIKGRILTTDYFFMTDPKALKALSKLDNIDVRMYRSNKEGEGFHTKGYLFDHDNFLKIIVGSSNITQYALTTNKEWNLELSAEKGSKLATYVLSEFDSMFVKATSLNEIYEEYRNLYNKHQQTLREQKEVELPAITLEPNYMQCKFIASLKDLINKGQDKALLISATGTGKTYAAAFAVKELQAKRMLFVVHRAQIAKQAINSFKRIFGDTKTYGLYTGDKKDKDCDFIFATVQTLSKMEYLETFAPRTFDFIIIDEVHRAGAVSYANILSFFKSMFLLGMTATPDRMDGFDIYSLFDHNIAYEIRLKDALEYSLLCPFHYFAITELEIDGQIIDDEAIKANQSILVNSKRVEHIIEKAEYYGYCGERVKGLAFCSTVEEAKNLSEKFNERGYRTASLSGQDSQEKRESFITRLSQDEEDDSLDYLFTVDIFNEGVDIPAINQVIMLRPTESPIIFIQQLGRGLRKAEHKDFIVVLDFIGNYSNNYMISQAFSPSKKIGKNELRETVLEPLLPGASSVHFDRISKERILSSIDSARLNTKKDLKSCYFNLKNKLNKIPTPMDIYNFADRELSTFFYNSQIKAYNQFVADVDSDYSISFTGEEQRYLDFISNYLIDGKRIEEIVLLKLLLTKGAVTPADYQALLAKYNKPFTVENYQSALRMLELKFVNAPSDKTFYHDIALVNVSDFALTLNPSFYHALQKDVFRKEVEELLTYAESVYRDRYSKCDRNGLVLYEKYTRRDVCRLLNWEKDESSTMYGYRIKYNTCPIFVTYNKDSSISRSTAYEDHFDSPSIFNWMTRNKVTLNSTEAVQLINAKENGLKVLLFVKKSDDEGIDFYYLGEVEPTNGWETTIVDDQKQVLPIVNFKLILQNEVKANLYDYIRD